uniref:Uncharacterized protein n=1 Tax=Heterosigma akashiwo TaxID=2829 RepID=A0A7S3YJN8_HETAK
MKIKRNQTNAMHTFHQASKQEVCDLGLIASQIASLRVRDAMKKMKIAESKEQRWYKIKPPHQQTHKDNLTGQQRAKVRAAQYLKRSKATENPTAAPKWYHDHAIKAENLSKRRSTKLSKDQKKNTTS